MTQKETRLNAVEKKIAPREMTDWVKVDKLEDGPMYLNGQIVTDDDLAKLREQGIGAIVLHRVAAPLPKED